MKNSALNTSLRNAKPFSITCYICGRQYGSKSFTFHIKSCQQKFHSQQQLKTNPKQKIALPEGPQLLHRILSENYDLGTLKIYNEQAYKVFKYKVLPQCKYCSRTFNYDSLKVHEKGCDKKTTYQLSQDDSMDNLYQKQYARPKTLLCCVCGRQFGTKSLRIHYPQCIDKFKKDQFIRCINPKDRRKPPQFTPQQIQLFNTKQQWSNEEIQEFYRQSMSRYRKESMMECYNCKRKFKPDSIQKHMKNCILINGNLNPQGHMKKIQSQKILHFSEKNIKKPKTLMCYICGRQFGLASLSIHQKTCFQKFKTQQKNKPKNQRKKLPQLTQQILQGCYEIVYAENWQIQKIQRYNKLVSDIFNKKSLTTCYICERTFFQQSLAKHIVHCENTLQKLKFKRNKSHDQTQIVKRCQSIQKTKLIQRSVEKQIIKPRVLMCHICGREFGLSSLPIHLKVCPQKFMNEQMLKQKQFQKQLPQIPLQLQNQQYNLKGALEWTSQKIQFYNKLVFDVFNKKSLQTCYLCERTFFQESLQKHFKHCQKYTLQKLKRTASLNEKQLRILSKHKQIEKQKLMRQNQYFAICQKVKPKTLVCHICGRQYGLVSLQIHLPKCAQKFIKLQNQKPTGDRKIIPSIQNQLDIQQFNINIAQCWSRQKIDMYNEICNRIYKHKSLSKCEYCNRTFFYEQIQKHVPFCQKQTFKNLAKMKQLDQTQKALLRKCKSAKQIELHSPSVKIRKQVRLPKLLVCHICGRQFGLSSLKIHLPQCKQKFIKQQQIKPQKLRKKLPELSFTFQDQVENNSFQPFDIVQAETWSNEMIRKYNEMCTQKYRKQSLEVCKYCNRSFFQQQLLKHLKFCQKQSLRKLKKSQSEKQMLTNYQGDMYQKQQNDVIIDSMENKLKTQIKSLQISNISNTDLVMSVIKQQQFQHSKSPMINNINQQINLNTQLSEFKLITLQVSKIDGEQKHNKLKPNQKKVYISFGNNGNKTQRQKIQNLTQIQSNSSFKKQRNKAHCKSMRVCKKSLQTNVQQAQSITKQQNQNTEKQCEHCRKKVKMGLYQRHIHMCKFNVSMTGYLKKNPTKLKV